MLTKHSADRQTHRTTTVTLAHARRGLTTQVLLVLKGEWSKLVHFSPTVCVISRSKNGKIVLLGLWNHPNSSISLLFIGMGKRKLFFTRKREVWP